MEQEINCVWSAEKPKRADYIEAFPSQELPCSGSTGNISAICFNREHPEESFGKIKGKIWFFKETIKKASININILNHIIVYANLTTYIYTKANFYNSYLK